MIIDCDECAMQHTSACDDCVVGMLLDGPSPVELADVEVTALVRLAEAGLVAPIRLEVRRPEDGAANG